ncbi:MAG: hypothetical protein H5U38_06465 [Calditrichaeota bacterium]|nr:hypothetical protein [Calditrichota bacterium]
MLSANELLEPGIAKGGDDMYRQWRASICFGLLSLVFAPLVLSPRPTHPRTEANRREGHTYYWHDKVHTWFIAAGAVVTAYKNGTACAEGASDGSGFYRVCLDGCRAPSSPPFWIDVVASYDGMNDYYSFLC